jgi:hypothetical protein
MASGVKELRLGMKLSATKGDSISLSHHVNTVSGVIILLPMVHVSTAGMNV